MRLLTIRRLAAEQYLLIAVILLALAYRLGLWSWPVDDAYITFRYARNLAEGNGLVYNIGERVMDTTTPFYSLLLGAASVLRLDIPVVVAYLSYRLVERRFLEPLIAPKLQPAVLPT
jgi:hypothetical protein